VDLPGAAGLRGDAAGDLPQRHRLAFARTLADAQLDGGVGQVVIMPSAAVVGARDRGELGGGDVGEQGWGPAAPVKAHRHPPPLADDAAQLMSLEDRAGRIRHDSATPVTVQVAVDIEADIDAGRLAPDTRLPSEAELATQYGVARVTVRRAIAQLRDRGKVVTVHGRGTYVVPDS
jgi:GntR family transcriptional regulator